MSAGLIGVTSGRPKVSEPTLKQWKRRALAAEEELAAIRTIFETHHENTMATVRENSVLRVALREVQDASNWAYGVVADKLQRAT